MDAHQTQIYIAVLITSVVIGTIIFYFAISIVRQQRKNLRLQRLSLLTEMSAIEREQTRIAADLHDELGPTLTVIKYEINSVEVISGEDQEILQLASTQLDEAVDKLRSIARNLIPATLLRKGLPTALSQFVEQTNQFTSLHVSLNYEISTIIDQERSINIYRLLQEVIQNAVKHSKADLLLIKCWENKNKFLILCEDNGIGFNYEAQQTGSNGLGLRNFRSRIDMMGGSLQAVSEPERGTQYIFEIPKIPEHI